MYSLILLWTLLYKIVVKEKEALLVESLIKQDKTSKY